MHVCIPLETETYIECSQVKIIIIIFQIYFTFSYSVTRKLFTRSLQLEELLPSLRDATEKD